ncbi:hypothetical protein HK101_008886 [Irineochytrium annulatum]|nr:hypothetical protein HK101_008886 [Irineochytrium annulatum]
MVDLGQLNPTLILTGHCTLTVLGNTSILFPPELALKLSPKSLQLSQYSTGLHHIPTASPQHQPKAAEHAMTADRLDADAEAAMAESKTERTVEVKRLSVVLRSGKGRARVRSGLLRRVGAPWRCRWRRSSMESVKKRPEKAVWPWETRRQRGRQRSVVERVGRKEGLTTRKLPRIRLTTPALRWVPPMVRP